MKMGVARTIAAGAMLGCAFVSVPALADSVSESSDGGFGRVVLSFDTPAHATAAMTSGVVTVGFNRKVTIDPDQIAHGLGAYVASARLDPDGKTLRLALAQDAKLHTSNSGNRFAIDLAPATYAGTPPNLPPPPVQASATDVAKLPPLAIRAGAYSNFSRIVFDWPKNVPYAVFPGSSHITVRFEAMARPDFTAFERIAPPWIKDAGWRVENRGTVLEFDTDSGSRYHDFRDGTHVVLDIVSPKSDADAYKPPGLEKLYEKPKLIAASDNAPAKPEAAAAAQQAQALVNAHNKPAPNTPAPNITTAAATPAPAIAQTASALPLPQPVTAGGQRTRDGAVVTFANGAVHPSAVFERGNTVWVVLDGAPPIDTMKLKASLGDFPASLDVSTGEGVSVLRIGLKQTESVSASAQAGNLKVTISPQPGTPPTTFGFVRNDDPRGAYLTTLVPGATRAITLSDPVVGDSLTVIPAIPGRGIVAQRDFVDFSVVPTVSGLVIAPMADDLAVAVDQSRIRISRPGGLALNAVAAPTPQSPAALLQASQGPTFIDFTGWGRATGGNFLNTERKLRLRVTQQKPDKVNTARLALARFYIANQFAAEALGLVDLMQATDPSLQGDAQLQTIRAAADYMMGRYHDAHNVLASGMFDGDAHAALWRGLTEEALDNQAGARDSLTFAETGLSHYPTDWQSRARTAEANAALAIGRLEEADAALSKLPHDMPKPLLLDAELARAKLYSRENRLRDAFALFDAVEQSGDERAAANAIYDHVEAGLTTSTMKPLVAIDMLEKLRFRWRGDALELKTLRKLGALYFSQQRWRDGLQTLRIASQDFPEDELSRQAQDDMRGAFVKLYLKGGADSMPPIQAVALFYDFIELTPIGADGDEMIRRMADRLMAVDLLDPAATLLNYQVTKRLDGAARAQVAARLAMVDLMNHKPEDALAAINTTRITGLPDAVNHQRMILEARSLAALKQWDQALDVIAVDEAPDSQRLRADIYWESGNWAVAGQKAEEMLADRWNGNTILTPEDRHEVMRAAIAYSLANDQTSLDRLHDHYAVKMKASPDANAFAVVTQNIQLQGAAFRDLAGQIASVDTLESFMQDFRKHYDAPVSN
jgi:tetratricopeptide (TPR) repeat protein